jgi:hypothetical protein
MKSNKTNKNIFSLKPFAVAVFVIIAKNMEIFIWYVSGRRPIFATRFEKSAVLRHTKSGFGHEKFLKKDLVDN